MDKIDAPKMAPLKEDTSSRLQKMALELLDLEVLQMKPTSSSDAMDRVAKERDAYFLKHYDEGKLEIKCRDVSFILPACYATQTAKAIAKHVSEHRPTVPLGQNICVELGWEPFIVDRIVDFWTCRRLNIKAKKVISVSVDYVKVPPNFKYDITDELTTMRALLDLYAYSILLEDEPLKGSVLGKLRHHVHGHQMTYRELLHCVKLAYAAEDTEDNRVIRRILLTILVMYYDDILTGEARSTYEDIVAIHPKISTDGGIGHSFYTGPYGDMADELAEQEAP